MVGGAELAGNRATNGFSGVRSSDGERDHMISALKLVTNLMKGNKPGVVVKGLADSSKNRLAEALESSIPVDNGSVSHHG